MSKGVKTEFDHGSSGISQQTLEDAAGVSNAGGDDVLPERGRPVNRFMENYHRGGLESDPGQLVLPRSAWLRVGSLCVYCCCTSAASSKIQNLQNRRTDIFVKYFL